MGPIVSPDQILSSSAKPGSGSVPRPIGQLLIVILQDLLCQFSGGDDDSERGSEPDRHDRSVLLRPLGETPEPDRLDVVEVADDRPRPRTGWKLETELANEEV